MSHPEGLPDLFLDRSLGRIKVPKILRDAGLRLTTLAEHYGVPDDELVADTEWLELAGLHDWIVFAKDKQVRYNLAEQIAIEQFGVRYFCLSGRSLSADEMAARFLRSLVRITTACSEPGPFVYAVHSNRIEKI